MKASGQVKSKNCSIFYFSSIDYDFLNQRPQQIFNELKKISGSNFNVYYVNPPSRKTSLIGFQNKNNIMTFNKITQIKSDINPLNLVKKRILKNILRKIDCNQSKKIAIIGASHWAPLISKTDFDLIIYDYFDTIEIYSDNKNFKFLKRKHEEIINKSDMIVTTSELLKKEIKSINPNKKTIIISNGVDIDYFKQNEDLIRFNKNKKIIGFLGAIYEWIDLEMIFKIAKKIPDKDFWLIGPISKENKILLNKKPKNVTFYGKVAYKEVSSFINAFDVALIPFKSGIIADSTDPVKLYEYFALGKPVVSSRLKEMEKYNDSGLLKIADNEDEYVNAIEFFIESNEIFKQNERIKIAEANSWKNKVKSFLNEIKTM